MGGVCSGGPRKSRKSSEVEHEDTSRFPEKLKSMRGFGKQRNSVDSYTYPDEIKVLENLPPNLYGSGELDLSISRELKPSAPAKIALSKAPESSFFGKASIAGLEKAVEVLDTLGSSVTNLNSGGFTTGVVGRGNKISVLAFEVANTIVKGANLVQSLSEEKIQFLKKDILCSEGVQRLVSTDMNELLAIAAADKREEFDVFSREVIRFGNMCKDPQWHHLDRFFQKLDLDPEIHKQLKEEADMTMLELTTLAQHTSELYHELHALDRFEQDYHRKLEEVDTFHLSRRGESLTMLQTELKHQRRLVKSLRKKSLWSKSLEQITEKFVDIVTFIHQDISVAFGVTGYSTSAKVLSTKPERLGVAGLALHYANIITQIDNIASRPTSLPPNVRDALYNGLPPSVKTALRSQIQTVDAKEELRIPRIKAEMEKTLKWLVPVAGDTTKSHQGFGWVGEWANNGNDLSKNMNAQGNLIRLQTLYHADKQKVESCILELVAWLHHLLSLVRYGDNVHKVVPARSPTRTKLNVNVKTPITHKSHLSMEDRNLLEEVMKRKKSLAPRLSKSQEFLFVKTKKNKTWSLSRSTGSSPRKGSNHPKAAILDVLDGLNSTFVATRQDLI